MNICQNPDCNNSTKTKFCSSSCAAKVNNAKRSAESRERQRLTLCKTLGVELRPKKTGNEECPSCGSVLKPKNKYCSSQCQQDYVWSIRRSKMDTGEIPISKRYLFEKYGHSCQSCDLSTWMGEPIPIEMDHIDGNYQNNTIDNLRLLCPNCHAQTPTYKNKNKGKGRHNRRERYAKGMSF